MPKTIEVTIYKIDELDEKAREKALENHRYWNVEIDDWYDFIYEDWKEKLADLGYEGVEIAFRGFWSQGDGASFTARRIDIPKWIEAHSQTYPIISKTIGNTVDISGKVERITFHYCHENTVRANLDAEIYDYDTVDEKAFNEELTSLENEIDIEVTQLSRKIYSELEEEYEYLTADEQVVESLEANEVVFYSDGRPFPARFLD